MHQHVNANTTKSVWNLICGSIMFFCLVFAKPLCASVYMCLVVTCWERAWLSFVVSYCEFVTSPLVSCVKYGTWLYRFLIFGLNIFISNQFIQYNTIFNHTNIRIRTEARAYQVLLLNNILTKCRWQWLQFRIIQIYGLKRHFEHTKLIEEN